MSKKCSIGKAVDMLIHYTAEAIDKKVVPEYGFIRKPLAWGLYMTWKYFDKHEEERKPDE